MKIKQIKWETDGLDPEDLDLPTEVELPEEIDVDDDDEITDYLSDTYGWLVISWVGSYRYEVYDHNDEVIDSSDDLEDMQISAEHNDAKFILDTETNSTVWEEEEKYDYECPECGHQFVQGEGNYNYDTSLIDFECPECGWNGTENQAKYIDDDDDD